MDVGFNKPDASTLPRKEWEEEGDSGTIFVRGLAPQVDDEKLLGKFSDVGPVKSAFVVRTGAAGASKGYGFVKFAIESDAQVAIETLNGATLNGRTIGVFPAQRKERVQEGADADAKPRKKGSHVSAEVRQQRREEESAARMGRLEERIGEYSSQLLANTKRRLCVIVLWNIPEKFSGSKAGVKQWLAKRDVEVKRLKNVVMNIDRQDPMLAAINAKPAIAIEFETSGFAKAVYHRLKMVKAIVRRHAAVTFKKASRQRCRLIVRNLSWGVRENDLTKAFSEYGPIEEVKVPTVLGDESRIRGFGFVQFMFHADATRAVQRANGRKIKGREVAVDWTQAPKEGKDGERGLGEDVLEDAESDSGVESDSSDDNDDSGSSSSSSDEDGGSESESESEVDSARKGDDGEDSREAKPKAEEYAVFVQNLPFDADKKAIYDIFHRYGACKMVKIVQHKTTNQSRGCAFVHYYRPEGVTAALAAGKGKLVDKEDMDTLSMSKTKRQAKNKKREREIGEAISEAALNGGILLGERTLKVLPAVKKEDLDSMAKDKKKSKKADKRHMYLGREGVIKKDDEAAQRIPKGDRMKRENAEAEKKLKLKNPNFFISPLRLSVRNISTKLCSIPDELLPRNYVKSAEEKEKGVYRVIDGKLLKTIAINAARDGMTHKVVRRNEGDQSLMSTKDTIWEGKRVKITEAKVVCDEINVDADGKPQSKGYGFVEFTEHAHALAALRMMNNNPQYFKFTPGPCGDQTPMSGRQRLIVEFSVEDARKVLKRRQRQELRKEKSLEGAKKANDPQQRTRGGGSGHNQEKQGRGTGAAPDGGSTRRQQGNNVAEKFKTKRGRKQGKNSHRDPKETVEDIEKSNRAKKGSAKAPTRSTEAAGHHGGGTDQAAAPHRRAAAQGQHTAVMVESERRLKRKRKKHREEAEDSNFDSLVDRYKARLQKSMSKVPERKKSRWFE